MMLATNYTMYAIILALAVVAVGNYDVSVFDPWRQFIDLKNEMKWI